VREDQDTHRQSRRSRCHEQGEKGLRSPGSEVEPQGVPSKEGGRAIHEKISGTPWEEFLSYRKGLSGESKGKGVIINGTKRVGGLDDSTLAILRMASLSLGAGVGGSNKVGYDLPKATLDQRSGKKRGRNTRLRVEQQ